MRIIIITIGIVLLVSILSFYLGNNARIGRNIIYYHAIQDEYFVVRHWLRPHIRKQDNICSALKEQLLPIRKNELMQPFNLTMHVCILNKKDLYLDFKHRSIQENSLLPVYIQLDLLQQFIAINFRGIKNVHISILGTHIKS